MSLINLKERLLYCQRCHRDETSDRPDARCSQCGEPLLTVVHSALDGQRWTGRSIADLGLPPIMIQTIWSADKR